MKRHLFLLLLCLPLVALSGDREQRFSELDIYARETPKVYERDMRALVNYLLIIARTEEEKARILFTWITDNISYDANAYNSGQYPDMSARSVFKRRRAVCEGFANLYVELGTMAGLEVVKVIGYSKGYGYRPSRQLRQPDHAWNAVRIDGRWALVDVTWGEGYGETMNGRLVCSKAFDPFWFDTPAELFITTHYPEASSAFYQLLRSPIPPEEFRKLEPIRQQPVTQ